MRIKNDQARKEKQIGGNFLKHSGLIEKKGDLKI
jgi:hypothetical protein